MNNYNPNIHHRRSFRLRGYDYSQAGLYFVTICVKDRKCLFGEIYGSDAVWVKNFQPPQEMILNDAGKIADNCWLEIPEHFPNVVLHEHIVMPNHIHGLIELKRIDAIPDNSDHNREHNHGDNHNQFSKPIPGSISVIIQQYKSSVTRFVNKNNVSHFRWQSRFYEHIIRNEKSRQQITDYILTNPRNWQEDKFFNE
ncbi:MAG: transposase [Bacteroidales bacterium]|jgi:REP element-mobilizing transposase RayT|nr:transposase [Bacteroidales bacterium]